MSRTHAAQGATTVVAETTVKIKHRDTGISGVNCCHKSVTVTSKDGI